jgi:hypothetical protein
MFKKKQPPATTGRRVTQPTQRGPVFSYANSRSVREDTARRSGVEQPEQPRRLPKFAWRKRLPSLALLLAITVLAVASVQLSSTPKLAVVGDSEGQVFLRDKSTYEQAASTLFTSFFNRNKLTVDTTAVAAEMRQKFPELTVVSVSLPIVGNQPTVYIQPASPSLILVANSGMYLLDSNGRALVAANQVTDLKKLQVPVVQDQSGLPVALGKVVLPKNTVRFISEVTEQLRVKKLPITSIALPAGKNEMQVRLKGVGYYVKFNLYGNAREEAGAFLAVKKYTESRGIRPGQYIDVRVENKAYYK